MIQPLPAARIDPHRLARLLGSAGSRFSFEVLPECTSTSTLLLERARRGAPSASLLIADRQTAGRGRRGRNWLSSPGDSLTFSLLWRFAGSVARLTGLSLAVGVALARALAASGVNDVGLKWPNDLLLGGGKLGGILVEIDAEPGSTMAVIGIGLNLELPPAGEEEFLQRPAALAEVLSPLPDRHQLLATILNELASVLDCFAQAGFAAVRDEWQGYHVWQDRQVRLLNGGLVDRAGICLGVDDDGALLLQTDSGVERCLAGDLSLRSA